MAVIDIRRKHNLNIQEACGRVDRIAELLRDKLKADYAWSNDSLHFKCPGATGHIDVDAENLDLTVKLSILLSPMKASIRESIEQYVDEALVTKNSFDDKNIS